MEPRAIIPEPPLDPERQWQAVQARDATSDGQFVYGVRSTGIYCRPICPSRQPKRENVSFYPTPAAAEAAGFRPCKRCHPERANPENRDAALIATACRRLKEAEEPPALQTLAAEAGLSPWHFHRLFKRQTGLTPKAYAKGLRAERLQTALAQPNTSVTAALYDAGFNSSGRFYEAAPHLLGMTPSAYRAGGADSKIQFAIGDCSLGAILVARSARGICAILIGDDPAALARDLQDRFPKADLRGGEPDFDAWVARVVGFVEAPALGLDLPLDLRGTAFQQRVWQALQDIPAGQTASYSEIAARIGAPRSVRAVAGACAANQIAVAIPCHRVVRTDGALSGYRWGVARKRALLAREARAAEAP